MKRLSVPALDTGAKDGNSMLWPSKGDRLLQSASSWNGSAGFSDHRIARDAHIWSGYMHAGAALIDACERSPDDRHDLVYPILFCYRHGLELAMKWIVSRYGRCIGVAEEDTWHHDLWDIWKICKQAILEVGPNSDDEELQAVEQIIKDFHDLDRNSIAFRYSFDKNGCTLPLPAERIDLFNIRDVMEAVDNFFTGADGALSWGSSATEW